MVMALLSAIAQPATGAVVEEVRPSFDEVYATCFRKVYAWVRANGCAPSDIEDVTQDVFVVVQRNLPHFDGRHLHAWLYRITARTVRDHRRSAWFRHLFARAADDSLDTINSATLNPLELLSDREDRRAVHELIGKLNATWRSAFVLFEIDGVSGEEIAQLEGITVEALWTRLHRARKQFAALVAARMRREVAR
jgi:RNA polymerase sigma factor (sigma-70 family)